MRERHVQDRGRSRTLQGVRERHIFRRPQLLDVHIMPFKFYVTGRQSSFGELYLHIWI